MSLRLNVLCRNFLRVSTENTVNYSTAAVGVKKKSADHRLITSRRKQYDHYSSMIYNKLDEVPLVSKGWNHSKAKGDFFTINPNPIREPEEMYSFQELGISYDLVEILKRDSIYKATSFQAKAMKTIRSGNHLLLAAETGCGKTLAYLLPIIQSLIGHQTNTLNSPKVVVIVPNRELAYQIGEVATMLSNQLDLSVKIITGGRTKKLMMNPTFEKVDILVATPGALGKLSTVGVYKLNEVEHTVLDEADTLLDDSFIDRLSSIIKRVYQSQFILVSATILKKIPDILQSIEPNLEQVISPKVHKPLVHITQKFMRLTKSTKPSHLLQLTKNNTSPMIVFTNRNETCNWLAMFLRENGVACSNINGDMNYAIRIDQWNQFVQEKTMVLAATDVASRGLNTVQVQHVLNYDFPFYPADYLHRIGRVGRLGSSNTCKVTNFISGSQEIRLVQQIEFAIRRNQPLTNVDGNITNIVQNKIMRQMKEAV